MELEQFYTRLGRPWIRFVENFGESHKVPDPAKLKTLSGLKNTSKTGVALPVSATGFVDGDVLVNADGGVVRMHFLPQFLNQGILEQNRVEKEDEPRFEGKHVFSPSMGTVRGLLNPPSGMEAVRERFLDKVQYVRHYRGLSEEEIVERLCVLADGRANHRNIGAGDNRWRMEIIALPKAMVEALDDDRIVSFVVNTPRPWYYVQDMVNLASNALQLTNPRSGALTWRRSVWKVSNIVIDPQFRGLTVPLEPEGNVYVFTDLPSKIKHVYRSARKQNEKIVVEESTGSLGIVATTSSVSTRSPAQWVEHLGLPVASVSVASLPISHAKSAVQKLIRLQPLTTVYDGVRVDSRSLLVLCCLRILHGPSQFLPHLQISVRGPTNLAKRLAVISVEDSDYRVLDPRAECAGLVELLAGAYLAMKVVTWFPSNALVEKWLRTALALLEAPATSVYSTAHPKPLLRFPTKVDGSLAAYFIRYLTRSFAGDMNMIEDVVSRTVLTVHGTGRPDTMSWEHIYDQHIHPSIGFLMPSPKNIHKFIPQDPKNIYWNVLQFMFRFCTGVNPRRKPWSETDVHVQVVRRAQRLYARLLDPPKLLPRSPGRLLQRFAMSEEWIAGAVGVQAFGKVRFDGKEYSMVWTLNPKEMRGDHVVVATPEPVVRGMDPQMAATALLNPSIQKPVIDGATAALTAGNVRLCAIPEDHLPRPEMYNARLRRVADRSYELQLNGSEAWVPFAAFATWNEHFAENNRRYVVPPNGAHGLVERECLRSPYGGMATPADIAAFARSIPIPVIRRMLPYLRHHRPFFMLNQLARDGGTKMGSETVHPLDRQVFQVLLVLSEMVPYALVPSKQPFRFKVPHTMLLQSVRSVLEGVVQEQDTETYQWTGLHDSWTLVPFQRRIVDQLKASHDRGKSNFFLNCKVGTGKTLMALQFIRESLRVSRIYWITPFTAFGGVIREMVEQGFRVNVCFPTLNESGGANDPSWDEFRSISPLVRVQSLRDLHPEPGTITLVRHLGLHKMKALVAKVSNAVVVCDEVHKMMRTSQKSSMAKTLCRNSKYLLCLTGTPILEVGYAKDLIPWLEPMCDFYVNLKNIVVGFNSMHSYRADLGIVETEETVEVPMRGDVLLAHNAFLEKGDLYSAYKLCHRAVTGEMVAQTKTWLHEGVFLVARDRAHQQELARAVSSIPGARVIVFGSNFDDIGTATARMTLHLTDNSDRATGTVDPVEAACNVVVVRMSQSEGYTVTKLGVRVTSVYFSNQATREQIQGRLIRISQRRKAVRCVEVVAGVLRNVKKKYDSAALQSACVPGKKISKAAMRGLGIHLNKRKQEQGPSLAAFVAAGKKRKKKEKR